MMGELEAITMRAMHTSGERNWDGRQWVGARRGAQAHAETIMDEGGTTSPPRWSRWKWVGREPMARSDEAATGDTAFSGGGHNPGGQRWVQTENPPARPAAVPSIEEESISDPRT